MKFKIHRGTNEIGGSCVEVWTEQTRIVLDIGMPLVLADGSQFDFKQYEGLSNSELIQKGVLPNIDGLYDASGKVDAILISHYHQDHHGFLSFTDNSIPVYTGEATHKILEFGESFSNGGSLDQEFRYFNKGEKTVIGNITLTPYWMDHSAFDAYAFLIEADGKRLFYSGDFRGHGRKQKAFQWFLHNAPKNVDYLLMEGTTIGRGSHTFKTEQELETDFMEVFQTGKGINLINTSAQNIDRIVTIYRACKRTGKTLVIDVYTAACLREMDPHATIPHASKNFPEIRVMYPYWVSKRMADKMGQKSLYHYTDYKISKDEISEKQNDIVFLVRPSMRSDLDRIDNLVNGNFIYSLWSGYLKQDYTKKFVDYLSNKGFSFHQIHTSGHADTATLKEMVAAIKPKVLVPIHTFDADDYQSIFSDVTVARLQDGEEVDI